MKFQLHICCQGDSIFQSSPVIRALTVGQKWIMGFGIMETEISCLNMSPLVKRMIESLSKFSTRDALSALAEVYLSCLMCLDESMRLLGRGTTVLSYQSFI